MPFDHEPKRGQIVMFRFTLGTSGRAIKRVVAVPGTTSTIRITVNGVTRAIAGTHGPDLRGSLTIPRGSVFHAEISIGSRSFGVVPIVEALGTIVMTLPSRNEAPRTIAQPALHETPQQQRAPESAAR